MLIDHRASDEGKETSLPLLNRKRCFLRMSLLDLSNEAWGWSSVQRDGDEHQAASVLKTSWCASRCAHAMPPHPVAHWEQLKLEFLHAELEVCALTTSYRSHGAKIHLELGTGVLVLGWDAPANLVLHGGGEEVLLLGVVLRSDMPLHVVAQHVARLVRSRSRRIVARVRVVNLKGWVGRRGGDVDLQLIPLFWETAGREFTRTPSLHSKCRIRKSEGRVIRRGWAKT